MVRIFHYILKIMCRLIQLILHVKNYTDFVLFFHNYLIMFITYPWWLKYGLIWFRYGHIWCQILSAKRHIGFWFEVDMFLFMLIFPCGVESLFSCRIIGRHQILAQHIASSVTAAQAASTIISFKQLSYVIYGVAGPLYT